MRADAARRVGISDFVNRNGRAPRTERKLAQASQLAPQMETAISANVKSVATCVLKNDVCTTCFHLRRKLAFLRKFPFGSGSPA